MLRQRIWRPPMDCAIKALEECSLQIALFTCKAQSRAQQLELREWKFDPHRNFELVGFQKTLG